MLMPPDHADHFVDLAKAVPGCCHPGAVTALVPVSPNFLTRPLIFRAGGGKPFKKIDT